MSDRRTAPETAPTPSPATPSRGHSARTPVYLAGLCVALASVALVAVGAASSELERVRERTEAYIEYNREIELTAEQRAVFDEALTAIPAPCCEDNSAATCCCPCNQARSWWGLAKHLIVEKGQGVEEVRAAVEGWIATIHPEGTAGDACYKGRCPLPFAEDGCGGMVEGKVAF